MTQFGLGLGYKVGDFSVGVGTTSVNNASWKLDGSSKANAVNNPGSQTLQAWQVGAEYKFGDFRVGVVSERTNSSLVGGVVANFDQSQITNGLVGGYKNGAFDVQVRYAIADDVAGTNAGGTAVTTDTGATQYGLAVGYQLHKNVQLVGSYTKIDNKRNASFTSASGFTLAKGTDMNQIALGVAISF